MWLRRFTWSGNEQPELGMYLVTDAGSGYHVTGVEETGRPEIFHFMCEKVEPADIPVGVRVVGMFWSRRS